MSIPFQSVQHFFLFEKRPANKLNGKVTSHPFACVAVGFEPSEPALPFRVSATFCRTGESMVRRIGKVKALGLLQSAFDGKHAHVMWIRPSQKVLRTILNEIGFTNAIAVRAKTSNTIQWTRAQKSFKNILTDIQGLRIHPKQLKVAKGKAR